MKLSVRTKSALSAVEGALIIGVFEEDKNLPGWIKSLPDKVDLLLKNAVKEDDYKGKFGHTLLVRGSANSKIRKILLIGLGKRDDWSEEQARKAAGKSRTALKSFRIRKVASSLFGWEVDPSIAKAQVEGFILSGYTFNKYKSKKAENNESIEIGSLEIINVFGENVAPLKRAVKLGRVFSDGAILARDLQAEPGNTATPTYLAAQARKIASASPRIKVKILDKAKIKKLKMGAFIGVSNGSQEPPKLIVLEYRGTSPKHKPIALVGKGITFDSGGISLKPGAAMEEMKYDMSGAAAVLGVFKALSELDLKENIVGVIPATENLPSGTALKPGDIVKTYSGKTIEIINTDAEGRLVLADALSYTIKNYKPSRIIDLATLTGSVVVALSTHATGIISNDADLTKKLIDAGETTGERLWELPLWDPFRDQIKSDFADMKNIGGKGGGTITAAALLENFVEDTPWAHLDIAGTAYLSGSLDYSPKGPTGVGVRLLLEYLSG